MNIIPLIMWGLGILILMIFPEFAYSSILFLWLSICLITGFIIETIQNRRKNEI